MSRSRSSRLTPRLALAAVSTALLSLAAVSPALAAVPVAGLEVRLLAHTGGGRPILLVSGTLPQDATLPAEVSLRVPAGSEVLWAGEVFGGGLEDDVEADPSVRRGESYDLVTLTLTRARTAQVEVAADSAVTREGDAVTAAVSYEVPEGLGVARVAVALPAGARVGSVTEGVETAGQEGTTYYYFERDDVKAGEKLELAVTFVPPGAPAPPPAAPSGDGGGSLLPLAVVGIAVGAPALALALRRLKRRPAEEDGSEPADGLDDAPGAAGAEEEPAGIAEDRARPADAPARLSPKLVIAAAAVVVIAVAAYAGTGAGGGPAVGVMTNENGVLTQRISTASGDSSARFHLTIPCECPPEVEAPNMFAALGAVPGVAHASLHSATMLMEIAFDPSATNEGAISEALAQAGYSPQAAR
ncbi:MAG: hypothetical protein IBX62_07735 [Coriobacteriia bacterium]|nr:hypothetical protein [Coriobacteriia bacterium]